tara:strand:+ start:110 stop:538 length:429 start_codon:yes stop_codon:yes gene_type:complete
MYRDPILWKNVRDFILEDGQSRREAALRFRMSRNTVRKMLQNEMPPQKMKRARCRPIIGPHEATIRQMMEDRLKSGYGFSPSIRDIYKHLSENENYCGSYSAVRDYALLLKNGPIPSKISEETWEYSSDVLFSLATNNLLSF